MRDSAYVDQAKDGDAADYVTKITIITTMVVIMANEGI